MIASRVGEATSLLEQSESGLLVEPTPAAIATAAVRMLQDQALRATLQANAKRYALNLGWKTVLQPIIDEIHKQGDVR